MQTESKKTMQRAFLGMPGYGEMTAGAGRGLWRASRGHNAKRPLDLAVSYGQGSLLAQNFNGLWCQALNECHLGRPVHYFGMLHADVEPEDGWLDVLIDELEEKQLDVLGAVVPIKDPKGLTSIALDGGDNWRPLCRLTMSEVYRLPETFTSAEVGHPLLLNTGCWVCRFDMEWARKVRFTINDRIIFNEQLNLYQAQVEPEDWYFSRLCHELKLRIGATRKVRLEHAGEMRFTNQKPWGQEFDATYVTKSILPELDMGGIRFPQDVDGWLSPEEGKALADLACGKRVLEIGSFCGRSTICLAQTADAVHSVDPHDGRGTPRPMPTLEILRSNLARYGIQNVTIHVGTIEEMHDEVAGGLDLVFIDGAHDLSSVRNDIQHALRLLKPGGLLAFHDYRHSPGQHDGRWDAGVTQAVAELLSQDGSELLSTHGTLAVVRPPQLEIQHACV